MLPQLGLFKKVPCPFLPDCPRTTCIFSHDPKLIKRSQPTSSVTTTATITKDSQSTLNKRQRPNDNSSLTTQDFINNIVKKQKTSNASLPELSHNTKNNNENDKKLNRIAHKPKVKKKI